MHKSIAIAVLLLSASVAMAQTPAEPVLSEERDAAFGYVSTSNFLIGRVARECLVLLSRPDSPQDFVRLWQARNAPFVTAAAKYMEKRLDELEATGATESRATLMAAMQSKAQVSADGILQSWLQKGSKDDVCQRSVALIDLGALDISAKSPMYKQLQALVVWADQ
jgi:hypothetical protein